LKPERWGSLLVQEKYQEEKACDKTHSYPIIIIIIIIIIMALSVLHSATIFQINTVNWTDKKDKKNHINIQKQTR
jgi:flagellar basal body-associated protein FliL